MKDTEIIKKILFHAEDFEKTAMRVNQSSIERKNNTEESISLLEMIINTGNVLIKEMRFISRESILLRNKYNAALNVCRVLLMNIEKQNDILAALKKNKAAPDQFLSNIRSGNTELLAGLKKAAALFEEIVRRNNEMALLDNLIISLKNFQNKKNLQLRKNTAAALRDTEVAIQNSAANYKRGAAFNESLKNIGSLVESGNKAGILEIAAIASAGRKSAAAVNKSSMVQFEFADVVYQSARRLHDESLRIREAAQKKYKLFNEVLEPIAELSVLVAVELASYLPLKDLIEKVFTDDPEWIRLNPEMANDLASYISSSCSEIESLANLNFDMTENIAMNSGLEVKTVELTGHEIQGYAQLKVAIEKMTEAARYPVEGSARNVENAKEIERALKKLAAIR